MGFLENLSVGVVASLIGSALGGGIAGYCAGLRLVRYQMSMEERLHDRKVLCEILTNLEHLEKLLDVLVRLKNPQHSNDDLLRKTDECRRLVPFNHLLLSENDSLGLKLKKALDGELPTEANRMKIDVTNLLSLVRDRLKVPLTQEC